MAEDIARRRSKTTIEKSGDSSTGHFNCLAGDVAGGRSRRGGGSGRVDEKP